MYSINIVVNHDPVIKNNWVGKWEGKMFSHSLILKSQMIYNIDSIEFMISPEFNSEVKSITLLPSYDRNYKWRAVVLCYNNYLSFDEFINDTSEIVSLINQAVQCPKRLCPAWADWNNIKEVSFYTDDIPCNLVEPKMAPMLRLNSTWHEARYYGGV